MKHTILAVALSLSVLGAAIGAPPDGPQRANPAPLQTPQPSLPSNDQQTSGPYYRSRDGSMVHRPTKEAGDFGSVTAICGDGTRSFSHSHRGTCSDHGGVAVWK
jgi:hypothetical protein